MRVLLVAWLGWWWSTPAVAADGRTKIAVMPLAANRVPVETVKVLDELLVAGVDAVGGHEVIGASDIAAMIGLENMKDSLGCSDTTCAAAIGGALGVDALLSGSVSVLGDEVILSLALIDVRNQRVTRRKQLRAPNDERQLARAVDDVVAMLFAKEAAPAAAAPTPAPTPSVTPAPAEAAPTATAAAPAPAAASEAAPVPAPSVTAEGGGTSVLGPVLLAGGGAALLTSGVLVWLAGSKSDIEADEYKDYQRTGAGYGDVEDAVQRHNARIKAAWAAAGLGVLALAGGLYVVSGEEPAVSVDVTPAQGGATLSLSGSF